MAATLDWESETSSSYWSSNIRQLLAVSNPVFEFYVRSTDLDLLHLVFFQEAFLTSYVQQIDNTGQITEKECPGNATGQTESWNITSTRFFDSATSYSTVKQYLVASRNFVTTSGCANLLPVWLRRVCFGANFLIVANFTTFRTISDTFVSISGFRILLPVHSFRLVAPDFLIEVHLALYLWYGGHTCQNTAKRAYGEC